jgi:asparagine synthase (glutamine-hydrolysing)
VFIGPGIALGNRRLSIVDRAHGQQPMANDEGTIHITYNGELFNFMELRRHLEGRGVSFRTASDTEVVLRAYEADGEACLDRFNGQFAFAIWDARRGALFLARDRLGIAPLHYTSAGGRFVFASEAKAILEGAGVAPVVDGVAVVESLLCGTLFNGRTLFQGIQSLEPGCSMTVTANGTTCRRYWDMPLEEDDPGEHGEAHYRDRILPLLEDAMRIRLIGEVPWGVMLSGGTDSSTLATLAVRLSSQPVQTFTIDFPNVWKGNDSDRHYARLMADRLGTRHHEFITEPDDYYATLERVTWHLERPFNKGAATMYLLYQQLKEHATVVITGEGADELFAGYVGERGLGLDEVVQTGVIERFPWAAYWEVTERLFSDEVRAAISPAVLVRERLDAALPERRGHDVLNQALYLYTKYFLLELLELHDRTSLASGVEARLPFLDHRLVELLTPMPSDLKARNGQTKYVFKQAVKDFLPPEILQRRKTPMPVPRDPDTLLTHLRVTREALFGSDARSTGWYDLRRVDDFLQRRNEFAGVDALCVWKVSMYLLTLELLHRTFRL